VGFSEQLGELDWPVLTGEFTEPGESRTWWALQSPWLAQPYCRYTTRPSWTATAVKVGRTPALSIATRPRLVSRWNSVPVLVQATWIQCSRPATHPPVSSK